jgi:hypothetical protein
VGVVGGDVVRDVEAGGCNVEVRIGHGGLEMKGLYGVFWWRDIELWYYGDYQCL